MKNKTSKIKSIFAGLLIISSIFVNSSSVLATNYPYNYPYTVVATPPPPPTATVTVTLSASVNPVHYPTNNMTTLVWNVGGTPQGPADSCDGTGGTPSWPGSKDPTYGVHQELISGLTPGTYVYYIDCYRGTVPNQSHAQASIMVIVDNNQSNPITVNLTSGPVNPINSGDSSNLSWTSTNATYCTTGIGGWQSPGNRPVNSASPESTGALTQTTTYSITCFDGQNNSQTAYTTVYVNSNLPPDPIIRFRATPSVIDSGQSSTLSWTITNGIRCYANGGPWSGDKSIPTGSQSTGALSTTTTYTLTCEGALGSTPASASATVYVNPIIEDPLPPVISYFQPFSCVGGGGKFGSSPKFAWDSLHTTSCTLTRITAPSMGQSVGVSSQASGGSLEFDGLYYFLSSLPVIGNSSSYSLQCVNGVQTTTQYAAVNVCSPDFTISANPTTKSFVSGINPGTGNPGKIATYTISVNPLSGFSSDVNLSIQSNPAMPRSTSFTFTPTSLSYNGVGYDTSVLTIGIDDSDFPPPNQSVTYSPIVVAGDGGGFTHTVSVTADATGKKRPVYIER